MSNEELIAAALGWPVSLRCAGIRTSPGFKYYASPHPSEQLAWEMACDAFELSVVVMCAMHWQMWRIVSDGQ